MITRELEDEHFKFWIEDGILYSEYKTPIDMDVELLKVYIALRHEISQGEKQYMCYSTKNLKSYSREARKHVTIYGQELLHASCAIIESHIVRFIFKTYIKVNKPHVPFQPFKSVADGISWLKEIKLQNEQKEWQK